MNASTMNVPQLVALLAVGCTREVGWGVLRAGQMAFISTGLWVYSCYFLELILLKMVNSY